MILAESKQLVVLLQGELPEGILPGVIFFTSSLSFLFRNATKVAVYHSSLLTGDVPYAKLLSLCYRLHLLLKFARLNRDDQFGPEMERIRLELQHLADLFYHTKDISVCR